MASSPRKNGKKIMQANCLYFFQFLISKFGISLSMFQFKENAMFLTFKNLNCNSDAGGAAEWCTLRPPIIDFVVNRANSRRGALQGKVCARPAYIQTNTRLMQTYEQAPGSTLTHFTICCCWARGGAEDWLFTLFSQIIMNDAAGTIKKEAP